MGLAARLAVITAVLAVVLVLGATEIALSWSERSRLEDDRREAVVVGNTLASYLTRVAPTGDRDSVVAAFGRWARNDVSGTDATVYLVVDARLETATAVDSSLLVPPGPLDEEAWASRTTRVAFVAAPEPTWRLALPLGAGVPFGILDVSVSAERLAGWAKTERRRAYVLAVASALLVAAGVAWLIVRWVGDPLRELGSVMAEVREGSGWGSEAPERGPAEFQALARRYNSLRAALIRRERESEARAALLALEERARTLERLAAMGETSASFAHEVGTPLNTARGHLQLLRGDIEHQVPSAVQRVDLLLEQLDRVTAIVRKSLDRYAWPAPKLGDVDVTALAARVLEFLDPSFEAGGVRRELERDAGEFRPVVARCDPAMVEQILLNLLKNAIEAEHTGGRVTVTVGAHDGRAVVLVADDGPGLSAEVQAQLFNPFATTKGPGGGTGLGLTISQRLARAQRGDLVLVPTESGVTWRLTLPIAGAPAEETSP
jgi:signal transduction histidine kinase